MTKEMTTARQMIDDEKMEDVAGFLPKREEFDEEWCNEAETQLGIADMEFLPEDSKHDVELKLKMLEIYNCRLDERERRTKLIVGHGLLNVKREKALERSRTKEQNELVDGQGQPSAILPIPPPPTPLFCFDRSFTVAWEGLSAY